MKRYPVPGCCFLLLLSLLLGPTATLSRAADMGQDLILFYTTDNHGETEPCGCEANQLGGLGKRGRQFQSIAAETGLPHLTVDGGDLLFKSEAIPADQEKQEEMTATAIAEIYAMIGYDAVCVGSRDLIAGVEYLRTLAKQGKVAWVSANLVDKTSGKPIFAAAIRRPLGKATATIIGLTGPTTLATADNAEILPWEKVLPALLDKAAKSSDLVVLLSNLPEAENRRIAEAYDSVHILIESAASGGSAVSTAPVNNTVIASTRPQGKDAGIMTIDWQPGKRWGCPPAEVLAQKKSALDGLAWQLSKYRSGKEDPEVALCAQPERLAAYRKLVAREQALQEEIKQLAMCDPAAGGGENAPSTYKNRFVTLESTLPDRRDVVAVSDRLDRALNQLGREQAKRVAVADSGYVGSPACAECHPEQTAAWRKTKHAGAYITLVDKEQQFNVNCLPCHVTGVRLDHASEALSLPEVRHGVGCEVCHGPGRQHGKAPAETPMIRQPEAAVCLACHAPPHDENFDYEQNVKLVH